jgi:hypothetical protein
LGYHGSADHSVTHIGEEAVRVLAEEHRLARVDVLHGLLDVQARAALRMCACVYVCGWLNLQAGKSVRARPAATRIACVGMCVCVRRTSNHQTNHGGRARHGARFVWLGSAYLEPAGACEDEADEGGGLLHLHHVWVRHHHRRNGRRLVVAWKVELGCGLGWVGLDRWARP